MIITKAVGKNSWEKKKVGIFSGASFGVFVLSIIIMVASTSPIDKSKQLPISNTKSLVENAVQTQTASDKSAEAYNLGLASFTQNDFEKALSLFQAVDNMSPNYANAQNKIKECNNNLAAQLVADAKRCLAKQDYNAALMQLKAALIYNPESEAKAMMPDVEKEKQAYAEKQKQEKSLAYKDTCESISYKVLNKNPDSHKGKNVKLRGQIMQIQEANGHTIMLLSVTSSGSGYWTDNVAVFYMDEIDAYEKDVVTIYGKVTGAYRYKSRAGWDITVPGVLATYVD